MDTCRVQVSEMESVLLRLQCVYATLTLIYRQSLCKPLYCAVDELMHVTDEFGDFLEEALAAERETG